MLLEVLQQIINLPLRLAQAIIAVFNSGTTETLNLTVTVGGRTVGVESKIHILDKA